MHNATARAMWAAMGEHGPPWQGSFGDEPHSIEATLAAIPPSVVAAKKAALAHLAARIVVQTAPSNGEHDAVARMVQRVWDDSAQLANPLKDVYEKYARTPGP